MALADRAKAQAAAPEQAAPAGGEVPPDTPTEFKKPDIQQHIPPDMVDPVARTVAAGMKLMYAPETRDEIEQAIQSQEPIRKKIADNTTGLLLTLDGKTKGGIPAAALYPVAVELAGECGEILTAAGQPVSQQDFNDALLAIYAMVGKKLGATDDQLMQSAQQALGEPMTGQQGTPPEPPQASPVPPQGTPPQAVPPQAMPTPGAVR